MADKLPLSVRLSRTSRRDAIREGLLELNRNHPEDDAVVAMLSTIEAIVLEELDDRTLAHFEGSARVFELAQKTDTAAGRVVLRQHLQAMDKWHMPTPELVHKLELSHGMTLDDKPADRLGRVRLPGSGNRVGCTAGRARVLTKPGTLKAGEILVCKNPGGEFDAAIANAGGLVMEGGGLQSHGQSEAGRLKIPCVYGIEGATTKIKTGQILLLDANEGFVEVSN